VSAEYGYSRTRHSRAAGGLPLAVASSTTFGLSGSFAKALIDSGWSASGTALVRLGGAAVVFAVVLAATRPGVIAAVRRDLAGMLLYGVLATAGVQVAYFNAVRYLAVPVALLLEFTGPVLVIAWVWLVRRQPPTRRTLLGGSVAVIGLVLVVRLWSADQVSWPGLAWGLTAAACQAVYFLKPDSPSGDAHFLKPDSPSGDAHFLKPDSPSGDAHFLKPDSPSGDAHFLKPDSPSGDAHFLKPDSPSGTPPLVLAGVGMVVGSVTVALLGLVGLLPLDADPGAVGVVLAGVDVGWPVAAGLMVLVSTVFAYLTGIAAVQRIGSSRSSLIGLLEVVSSAIAALLLLGEVPGPVQAAGGALILAGVALTQTGPARRSVRRGGRCGTGSGSYPRS
jgi:drug/metabolite transporter (DMT)-like permease